MFFMFFHVKAGSVNIKRMKLTILNLMLNASTPDVYPVK